MSSTMLPDTEIAAMRTEANRLMADTMDVYRRTTVDDGAGGTDAAWARVHQAIPAAFYPNPRLAMEVTIADALQGRDRYSILVATGTDLLVRDKAVKLSTGQAFYVVGPETERTWEIFMAYDAELIQ